MTTNVLKLINLILFTEPAFFGRAQFMRFELEFSSETFVSDHIRRLSWLGLGRIMKCHAELLSAL
jgi:hypothetical protein